jgi:serine/threonine protein kinase
MSRCPHCGDTHSPDNHFCPATGKAIDLGPRLVGLTLLERYKIETILGEGPTGIVFQVEEIASRRKFAAKLTHPRFVRGSNAGDVLLKEAALAGKLDCPHIARVVDVGRDTGAAPVIVRELMKGRCLAEYLDESGPFPVEDALHVGRDILVALDAIHRAGILNLDLSPADVFLDESQGQRVTKLVDFGEGPIKQAMGAEEANDIESHKYYAPEQRRKGHKADARADIFAAGAILYHMLAGKEPARLPTPLNSARKEIDPKLSAVVHKALAAAPESRHQTAADFIAAIDDVVRSMRAAKEPAPVKKPAPEPPRQPAPAKEPAPVKKPAPEPPPQPAPAKEPAPVKKSIAEPRPSAPVVKPAEPLPPPPAILAAAIEPEAPAESKSDVAVVLPTGSDAELEQPSVIVDMPEVHGAGRRKALIAVAVVVVLAAGAAALYLGGAFSTKEQAVATPPPPPEVTVTIRVVPENAVVSIDGARVMGNPPTVKAPASSELHTIKAKADGYESLEKDVAYDATKTVDLQLIEIVAPPGEASPAPVEPVAPVAAPQPELEPEPEPAAVVEKPAAQQKKTAPAAPKKTAAQQKQETTKPAAGKPVEAPAAGAKQGGTKTKSTGKKKNGFDTSNPYG